jgi:hypothetical protein
MHYSFVFASCCTLKRRYPLVGYGMFTYIEQGRCGLIDAASDTFVLAGAFRQENDGGRNGRAERGASAGLR